MKFSNIEKGALAITFGSMATHFKWKLITSHLSIHSNSTHLETQYQGGWKDGYSDCKSRILLWRIDPVDGLDHPPKPQEVTWKAALTAMSNPVVHFLKFFKQISITCVPNKAMRENELYNCVINWDQCRRRYKRFHSSNHFCGFWHLRIGTVYMWIPFKLIINNFPWSFCFFNSFYTRISQFNTWIALNFTQLLSKASIIYIQFASY